MIRHWQWVLQSYRHVILESSMLWIALEEKMKNLSKFVTCLLMFRKIWDWYKCEDLSYLFSLSKDLSKLLCCYLSPKTFFHSIQFIHLPSLKLGMLGDHQLQNAVTATCTALCLRNQGYCVPYFCLYVPLCKFKILVYICCHIYMIKAF